MSDTLPFNLRLLKVDQKAKSQTGCAQVIETLRRVLGSETLHTLDLDNKHIFDDDIREVLANAVTLYVMDREACGTARIPLKESSFTRARS